MASLSDEVLDVRVPGSEAILSVRRLWEHLERGQISPFRVPLSASADPAAFVDLGAVDGDGKSQWLCGTLADLHERLLAGAATERDLEVRASAEYGEVLKRAANMLRLALSRRAVRGGSSSFLPPTSAGDRSPFGIFGLFSGLVGRLASLDSARSSPEQWWSRLCRLPSLRAEELDRSGLQSALTEDGLSRLLTPAQVAALCSFRELRLSIIPVQADASEQVRFVSGPWGRLRATKARRPQWGQSRTVLCTDRVFGYRVERVNHPTLWGTDAHWQAVRYDGSVMTGPDGSVIFPGLEQATAAVQAEVRSEFPLRDVQGNWADFSWTGGQDYREWLVTLPMYPSSFFSTHFDVRNILLHIRCDIRRDGDGNSILLVHELQSDWARDPYAEGSLAAPFRGEWQLLGLKLLLLQAAHRGLDAIAWTRGEHQTARYRGLGAQGLLHLYDRVLPKEANKLLKPFGISCEPISAYVPLNFSIQGAERGYRVQGPGDATAITVQNFSDARAALPAGKAFEALMELHGLRLPVDVRKRILSEGFPAWGLPQLPTPGVAATKAWHSKLTT